MKKQIVFLLMVCSVLITNGQTKSDTIHDLTPQIEDGEWLDDLLNSELSWRNVHGTLEMNAKRWSENTDNTHKVYEYLAAHLSFDLNESVQPDKYEEWANNVKILATSRDNDVLRYLMTYLEDETEFKVKDWSAYRDFSALPRGAKPRITTLRLCDVAAVALIRALNQFEYEYNNPMGSKFLSMIIRDDILSPDVIKGLRKNLTVNIHLHLFEREIRATPELKRKLTERLSAVLSNGN